MADARVSFRASEFMTSPYLWPAIAPITPIISTAVATIASRSVVPRAVVQVRKASLLTPNEGLHAARCGRDDEEADAFHERGGRPRVAHGEREARAEHVLG